MIIAGTEEPIEVCKKCGLYLYSGQSLDEHKLFHNQIEMSETLLRIEQILERLSVSGIIIDDS